MVRRLLSVVIFLVTLRFTIHEECSLVTQDESAFEYQTSKVKWKYDPNALLKWLSKQSEKKITKFNKALHDSNQSLSNREGIKMGNHTHEGSTILIFKDETQMKAMYREGYIQGKVQVFDSSQKVIATGNYERGLPNGPFWIFNDLQFGQVHFRKGKIG